MPDFINAVMGGVAEAGPDGWVFLEYERTFGPDGKNRAIFH